MAYLDGIIIFDKTFDAHMINLLEVINKPRENTLRVN